MTQNVPVSDQNPLRFLYTLNQGFFKFGLVSILSVLKTQTRSCEFHIVHDGDLDDATQQKACEFIQSRGGAVEFHTVPELFPREFAQHNTTWDIAVMYRLAAAQILPETIGRIQYLDGDTMVRRPLDEMFEIDLGEQGFAAVPEEHIGAKRLGLPRDAMYLNSGVLALDLDVWRKNRTSEKLLAMVTAEPDRWVYPDQDILAVHFADGWSRIPPEFNCTHRFFGDKPTLPLPTENPYIVHFSGQNCKPWETHREHPFADEFWALASEVDQAGFAMPERPKKKYKWYQRGLIAAYKEDRLRRRKRRRARGRAKQLELSRAFRAEQIRLIETYAPDLVVAGGPFQGMRYPQAYSHGSTLSPKLLGTYEAELNSHLDRLLAKDYPLIIDIGGAEGYYAIGAAMRWPNAKVLAYELGREARDAMSEMAEANGVCENLDIRAECMFGDLYEQRAFVICDIEGCEAELLVDEDAAAAFANCDFLIETHDMFRPGICETLRAQFAKTHEVTVVSSVDDEFRPDFFSIAKLAGADRDEQVRALGEHRTATMQWLICESRNAFGLRSAEQTQWPINSAQSQNTPRTHAA